MSVGRWRWARLLGCAGLLAGFGVVCAGLDLLLAWNADLPCVSESGEACCARSGFSCPNRAGYTVEQTGTFRLIAMPGDGCSSSAGFVTLRDPSRARVGEWWVDSLATRITCDDAGVDVMFRPLLPWNRPQTTAERFGERLCQVMAFHGVVTEGCIRH